MSKHSERHRKARMIRAASSGHNILCEAAAVEWIKAAEGGSADDAPKKFRMRAYTGGPMQVDWYSSPVVIDLAGLTAKAPVPILLNHDIYRIVGHADEVSVGDSALDLAGLISGASPEAAQVVASAKAGFPWKASVGARPDKMEFVGEGVTTKVNGKTFTGPLYVARRSTLGEVSFVPMAADPKTSAKVAASAANSAEKESEMNFDQWVQALFGGDLPELTDAQKVKLRAKFDAEVKAAEVKAAEKKAPIEGKAADPAIPPGASAPTFDLSAVIRAYETHIAVVEAKASSYVGKIEANALAEIKAKAQQSAAEIKVQALNESWPAPRLEVALVKAQAAAEVDLIRAERPKGPGIQASTKDTSPQVIEAAFAIAAGLRTAEKVYKPEILEAASQYTRREGVSLQGMILAQARMNGYSGAVHRIHRGNYGEAMRYASLPIQAVAFSTHSLTTILSDVGNKFLLEGFMAVEQVWREIAAIRPVSDFKTITSYRMLDDMVFEEIGPNGEIHHGTVSQESYTNQAKTYAKMFALRREDIINDDLGAFDSIRERIGVGSGRKLNSVFWTAFLDDATFFSTGDGSHANLLTTPLSEAGIAAANVLLKAQLGEDGHPIAIGGQHLLLTGATLNPTARKWFVAQELRDTTASTKYPTTNIYQNQFRPVESAYISSTTAWYLLPVAGGSLAPMEVCFLDNVQSPTIESSETDFNTLGMQFRGYFDFGATKKEWRASVKSTGTG